MLVWLEERSSLILTEDGEDTVEELSQERTLQRLTDLLLTLPDGLLKTLLPTDSAREPWSKSLTVSVSQSHWVFLWRATEQFLRDSLTRTWSVSCQETSTWGQEHWSKTCNWKDPFSRRPLTDATSVETTQISHGSNSRTCLTKREKLDVIRLIYLLKLMKLIVCYKINNNLKVRDYLKNHLKTNLSFNKYLPTICAKS